MKIVAKTKGGFLVEMTEDEAANAAGFYSSYSDEWRALKPDIGTTINFKAALGFHSRIHRHQDEARKSAGILRALAEMIDGALPDVVIPEVEEKTEAAQA